MRGLTQSCVASPIFGRILQAEIFYYFFVPHTVYRTHVTESGCKQLDVYSTLRYLWFCPQKQWYLEILIRLTILLAIHQDFIKILAVRQDIVALKIQVSSDEYECLFFYCYRFYLKTRNYGNNLFPRKTGSIFRTLECCLKVTRNSKKKKKKGRTRENEGTRARQCSLYVSLVKHVSENFSLTFVITFPIKKLKHGAVSRKRVRAAALRNQRPRSRFS